MKAVSIQIKCNLNTNATVKGPKESTMKRRLVCKCTKFSKVLFGASIEVGIKVGIKVVCMEIALGGGHKVGTG